MQNDYCQNKPEIGLIGDITDFTAEEILKMAKIPEGRKVDVIFGGPPCQAFSTAGNRKAFDDERGNVFLKYLSIISEINQHMLLLKMLEAYCQLLLSIKTLKNLLKGAQ